MNQSLKKAFEVAPLIQLYTEYAFDALPCQLPEERKVYLLKNLAECSPYVTPQDSRQLLPFVVQLLKDVAVKVFSKQEYSDDLIYSFRKEVSLMKRFRHPNVLLFMGAVTSPQRLCIVTEFLPRTSPISAYSIKRKQ
ncbi:putative serine/threonine-protein kinase SIS8 [Camellia lanceoleosa]|uniref:Serine/threonine-protein kinase SIS8 n=1 Tax=Camellia lanceoleosa TaxID=1840588 RepID=A0ACC0I8B7_9ERIC|nr:putative serine/threonine-protein kinase SIS8 [Camellia lanceoleosa]